MDYNKKNNLINFILKMLMISIFTIGAIIFSYPFVSDSINNFYDQQMMRKYLDQNNEAVKQATLDRIEEMKVRNEIMTDSSNFSNIPGLGLVDDPFTTLVGTMDKPEELYFEEHLLGAIYIPTINVSLPMFDTTNDILLEKGATLLQGTSFPIGGESTHSVITSHSGLAQKKLFTDLEKLEVGDLFYIEVGEMILAYKVSEFHVVLPDEVDVLVIQEGKDLVTLLTCTPYMVNTHRLLVTAERVEFQVEEVTQEINTLKQFNTGRVFVVVGLLILFLVLSFIMAIKWYINFISASKVYDISFKPLNISDDNYLEYRLHSMWGKVYEMYTPKISNNGHLLFKDVKGGKYRIYSINKVKNKEMYIAKLKLNRIYVYYKESLIKKIRVDNDG